MNPPNLDQPQELNSNNGSNNNANNFGGTQNLPNSVGVLVLGILSICFFWCYGIFSIIMAIISLALASGAEREYKNNPGKYSLASYKNVKAGKICSIIALSLIGLSIIIVVLIIVLAGSLALGNFHW